MSATVFQSERLAFFTARQNDGRSREGNRQSLSGFKIFRVGKRIPEVGMDADSAKIWNVGFVFGLVHGVLRTVGILLLYRVNAKKTRDHFKDFPNFLFSLPA